MTNNYYWVYIVYENNTIIQILTRTILYNILVADSTLGITFGW